MDERHMGTFLPIVDTWHWLTNLPDLASMPGRLAVNETSTMQIGRYWEYPISEKILQILPAKVVNRCRLENSRTPNLLSHSDYLVGTPQ